MDLTAKTELILYYLFIFPLQERDLELEMGDDYILDLQSKS